MRNCFRHIFGKWFQKSRNKNSFEKVTSSQSAFHKKTHVHVYNPGDTSVPSKRHISMRTVSRAEHLNSDQCGLAGCLIYSPKRPSQRSRCHPSYRHVLDWKCFRLSAPPILVSRINTHNTKSTAVWKPAKSSNPCRDGGREKRRCMHSPSWLCKLCTNRCMCTVWVGWMMLKWGVMKDKMLYIWTVVNMGPRCEGGVNMLPHLANPSIYFFHVCWALKW